MWQAIKNFFGFGNNEPDQTMGADWQQPMNYPAYAANMPPAAMAYQAPPMQPTAPVYAPAPLSNSAAAQRGNPTQQPAMQAPPSIQAPANSNQPQQMPSFAEVKQELATLLKALREEMLQSVTMENKLASYEMKAKADLNNDGTISGPEESAAIMEIFMASHAPELYQAIQQQCTNRQQEIPAEAGQMLDAFLTAGIEELKHNQEYISAEKALVEAIEKGEDIGSHKKKLLGINQQQMMKVLPEHPLLQMIDAMPFNDAQKKELASDFGNGLGQIQMEAVEKTVELFQQQNEQGATLRKAVLAQKDIGELSPVKWTDLCKQRAASHTQQADNDNQQKDAASMGRG